MGRKSKWVADLDLPPVKDYWRTINRHNREVDAWKRMQQKARDKRRAKCRCEAYAWPHRPKGGLCRHPDPPVARWKDIKAAEIAERLAKFRERFGEPTPAELRILTGRHRPYRERYTGIRRQIARTNGLHPIRDRVTIDALMPRTMDLAKQLHLQHPKYKYRNMEITEDGLTGHWTTAGPTM